MTAYDLLPEAILDLVIEGRHAEAEALAALVDDASVVEELLAEVWEDEPPLNEFDGAAFADRPRGPGPPGPPPRPGLVWKQATQRWIRKSAGPAKPEAPSGAGGRQRSPHGVPPKSEADQAKLEGANRGSGSGLPENRERIDRSVGGGAPGSAPTEPIDPKARETAERWVGSALPEKKQRQYVKDLAHVLTKMPAPARALAEDAISKGGAHFYPDLKTLRAAARAITGKSEKGTGGFVRHGPGGGVTLHADGGPDPTGTYAHELWHAVDGDGSYSDQPAWVSAHRRDIINGKSLLSRHALVSPREGFAEFGWGIYNRGRDYMMATYPACWAFLESQGLL